MRFSSAFVSLVAAATVSARISSLLARSSTPDCLLVCIADASLGDCSSTDDSCLCQNSDFVSSVTDCVVNDCPSDEIQTALDSSEELCEAVGITIASTYLPSTYVEALSASATAAASGSGSAAAATTTATTATTAATTTTSSSASSSNGALTNGVNAVAGLAAAGLLALIL